MPKKPRLTERPILFGGPMVRAIMNGRKTQTRRIAHVGDAIDPEHTLVTYGDDGHSGPGWYISDAEYLEEGSTFLRCPYGQIGDRLWVRETWRPDPFHLCGPEGCDCDDVRITYRADGASRVVPQRELVGGGEWAPPGGWQAFKASPDRSAPAIFMPRWASRLTLEIADIRVQRIQEVTEEDARAEGVPPNWVDDLPGWIPEEHGYLTPSGLRDLARDDGRDCGEDLRASDGKPAYVFTAREAFEALWDHVNGKRAPWAANPWVWALTFRVLA